MFDRRIIATCCLLALPCASRAQVTEANYFDNRWYITPFGSYVVVDSARQADDGWGGGLAIGRAIKTVDKDIIYVALYGTQMQKAAERLGLPMALEGFPDRRYADDGNLAARSIPNTVLKDPKLAAEQAIRMVRDGEIVALSGKRIKVKVHTLCVHGDEATGVVVARGIRQALEAADISVVPLTDMKL